jgi:hypothetical protein
MIERGECLALVLKSSKAFFVHQFRSHCFHGNTPTKLVVGSFGEVHRPHPSAADPPDNPVGANGASY